MPNDNRPDASKIRDDERSAKVRAEAESRHRDYAGEYDADAPGRRRRRPRVWRRVKWIFRILILLLVVLGVLFLIPRIRALFTPDVNISVPESLSELLPDEEMGYSRIDFSNAILGESREKSDFVVLEQDVSVTTRVSQALANLALFEKYQIIRSYGTGVYTVDLSALSEDDVTADETLQVVTVSIPHAKLAYVTVDIESTEYEETEKALFAFGEIKLTNEQLNLLEQSVDEAMRIQLDSDEMMEKADVHAVSQVQSLFEPIVQSLAPEYVVVIELQD
jgi:hypothetical protein